MKSEKQKIVAIPTTRELVTAINTTTRKREFNQERYRESAKKVSEDYCASVNGLIVAVRSRERD